MVRGTEAVASVEDAFMLTDAEAQHAYESEVEAFASAFARDVCLSRRS